MDADNLSRILWPDILIDSDVMLRQLVTSQLKPYVTATKLYMNTMKLYTAVQKHCQVNLWKCLLVPQNNMG